MYHCNLFFSTIVDCSKEKGCERMKGEGENQIEDDLFCEVPFDLKGEECRVNGREERGRRG